MQPPSSDYSVNPKHKLYNKSEDVLKRCIHVKFNFPSHAEDLLHTLNEHPTMKVIAMAAIRPGKKMREDYDFCFSACT